MPNFDAWWMSVLRYILGHVIDYILSTFFGRRTFLP